MPKIYGPYCFGKVESGSTKQDKLDEMLREMVADGAWVKCPICQREFPAEMANKPGFNLEAVVGVCMECGLLLCHPCYDAHCPCNGKPTLHVTPCTMPEKWRG